MSRTINVNRAGVSLMEMDQAIADAIAVTTLDGTNTTRLFWNWWPVAEKVFPDKYQRLSRWAGLMAQAWKDKTYTVQGYAWNVSGAPELTPLDDLAALGKAALATDTDPSGDDWAEEDPMTWYIRGNALSRQDGTMDILALEGEEEFDLTGETAPVYAFSMALWRREVRDEQHTTKSWRTTWADGFRPYAGDVAPDGEKRALTWHPSFGGGLNSKGNLTSGVGRPLAILKSAVQGLEGARKWNAYEGLWCDCDTEWLLDMWQLRHQEKENSGILAGCTDYNFQYKVAAAEKGVSRVLVTTVQGAKFIVGSTVSVGDNSASSDYNRNRADYRNLADQVQITSIEDVSVGGTKYTALNLDLGGKTIDVPAGAVVSTMPWHTGSTERVPGHKDGCVGDLTSGRSPSRVAGVEVEEGAYVICLDPLYNAVPGTDSTHFTYDKVAVCRDSEKLATDYSIPDGYEETGVMFTDMPAGISYIKEFAQNDDGVIFPSEIGGSRTQWYKSAFHSVYGTGITSPWRFFGLNGGTLYPGLAGSYNCYTILTQYWNGAPRLGGSGKKRGVWNGKGE